MSADTFSRDYVLLVMRMDRAIPGLIDAYTGPAELKAQVDAEEILTAVRLREQASTLLGRIDEVDEPDRKRWLQAQLVSLEAQALKLSGDPLSYTDYLTCCFDLVPERVPDQILDAETEEIDRLLPRSSSNESLAERLAAWDARFFVPGDRLRDVTTWLVDRARESADRMFGLTANDSVEMRTMNGEAWTGYSEFLGNGRSRLCINTDLPITVADLLHLVAHETYPGHHTERCWKERHLAQERGRVEATIVTINTPECLISEGMATIGERFAAPDDVLPDLLVEAYSRAGLPIAVDAVAAREAAQVQTRMRRASSGLRGALGNAAFLLHAGGTPRPEVVDYLNRYLLTPPVRTEKQMTIIEDPLYRGYVIAWFEGERLIRRWLDLDIEELQPQRFARLMHEQLTPSVLEAELSAAGFGRAAW